MKCKVCAACSEIIKNKSLPKETRQKEREKYEAHLKEVLQERLEWHHRRDHCLESEECATIYLDGMDQQKTDIPRLTTQDIREITNPMKVRYDLWFFFVFYHELFRLIGGLLYFKKTIQPFGFFFPGNKFAPDTNSNLECLRRILEHIGVENLPDTLYIQLDNTCKDNKNWIFFSYCAYLVLSGYGC